MIEKISLFINESKREFKRVNWPTAQETIRLTVIVIAISFLTTVFLGLADLVFIYGLDYFLIF